MLRQQLPSTAALYDTLSSSIGWLKPNNIKASIVNKSLLLSATLFTLVAEASAACFETPDVRDPHIAHDTSLHCRDYFLESDLVDGLYTTCKAFPGVKGVDYVNDACPAWLTQTFEFGHTVFSGPRCTLTMHQKDAALSPIEANPCVINYLNDNVPNGFDKLDEPVVAALAIVGTIAVVGGITCVTAYRHSLFGIPKTNNDAKAPLLTNDGPSEVTPTGIEETETPKPSMA